MGKDKLRDVTRTGMDETSRKKEHNYVTLFADLEQCRVVHVCEGRGTGAVANFIESLEDKGGNRENIEIVSMDMSPSFISGVMEYLLAAQMVFDKFHPVQLLNNALDEVRKAERKGNDLLKGHKYTVLKKYGNLSGQKKSESDYVSTTWRSLQVERIVP